MKGPKAESVKLSPLDMTYLDKIYTAFSLNDAQEVKNFEKTTNHDVKAVEYFIKSKLS